MSDDERVADRVAHADEQLVLNGHSSEFPTQSLTNRARGAARWARREILLALLAAFIVGLGAGAAEALISWLTS